MLGEDKYTNGKHSSSFLVSLQNKAAASTKRSTDEIPSNQIYLPSE